MKVLFRNARIFDGWSETLQEGCDVLVTDDIISSISSNIVSVDDDTEIVNCDGKVLMPGLIDAHVHVYACSVELPTARPATYLAHYAARFLAACLDRGFTSVRDTGGADVGLATALQDGLLVGPRLFYGGRIITQTGGGNDQRSIDKEHPCGCSLYTDHFTVVADGQESLRRVVREELRRGAHHIKIMLSGSIASPHSSVKQSEYSDLEIRTIVEETTRAGKYVAAHCHTVESIRRAVTLGVRSIEHGTSIDEKTADLVARCDAFVVPTIAVGFELLGERENLELPPVYLRKVRQVWDGKLAELAIMKQAGVKIGLGSDLIGPLYAHQTKELAFYAQVLRPLDVLRSACAVNAELLGEKDRLGCVREGAMADLLVVDGNPLSDISTLTGRGKHLRVILHAGRFHKRTI